ncbi:MAG: hypothetical protein ACOYL6_09665 [Bacteriovoracaceae bacterium]
MKQFFLLFLFFVSMSLYARDERAYNLSLGSLFIGENRIPIDLNSSFPISLKKNLLDATVEWVPKSVQWVRVDQVLLLPRAAIKITLPIDASRIHLRYQNNIFLMQSTGERAEAEIFVSLFKSEPIQVFIDGIMINEISVKSRHSNDEKNILIDYSCAPYGVTIEGLSEHFASVGCHLLRQGNFGEEYGVVEIHWAATDITLLDGSSPPFVGLVKNESPLRIQVKNDEGKIQTVTIKAHPPAHLKRFRTAFGVGPYAFKSQISEAESQQLVTPSYQLYGNFTLDSKNSMRFFDALIWQKSFFNNFGLYYASEISLIFDNRLQVVSLLGGQMVNYVYNYRTGFKSYNEIIYPQGFELNYLHAFGLHNYTMNYGMFLYPFKGASYQNLWLRFGKRVFVEANYLSWENLNKKTSMYGLSIGLPLFSWL